MQGSNLALTFLFFSLFSFLLFPHFSYQYILFNYNFSLLHDIFSFLFFLFLFCFVFLIYVPQTLSFSYPSLFYSINFYMHIFSYFTPLFITYRHSSLLTLICFRWENNVVGDCFYYYCSNTRCHLHFSRLQF